MAGNFFYKEQLWLIRNTIEKDGTEYVAIGEVLRPWSSWTANSDKKYMELNGAALNVNKPCVTSPKTAFPKDK